MRKPFRDRQQIDVVVPIGTRDEYLDGGWTGFKSITEAGDTQIQNTFTVGHITYEITSISPDNRVSLIDFADENATEVTIPKRISHDGKDYRVTAIGDRAFYTWYLDAEQRRSLTKVTFDLPSNVTSIGVDAFYKNQLTEIDISGKCDQSRTTSFWD